MKLLTLNIIYGEAARKPLKGFPNTTKQVITGRHQFGRVICGRGHRRKHFAIVDKGTHWEKGFPLAP